jgi:hypothetical protein
LSKNPEPSSDWSDSELLAGWLGLDVDAACAPRSSAIAPKNAITAAARRAVFALSARALAAAIRESAEVVEATRTWKPSSLRVG